MGIDEVAAKLVESGKGILAADESSGTIANRLEGEGLVSTVRTRRDYREMLFTTEGLGEHISGVIMFTETLGQLTRDAIPFVDVLRDGGMIPGVKVDLGTVDMPGYAGEKVTRGIVGLPERADEYVRQGAEFAKFRTIYTIGEGLPSEANIVENSRIQGIYAKIMQIAGLTPIVEPEVLMEGSHSVEDCYEVTSRVLRSVFEYLDLMDVNLAGMVLKPNMVVSGADNNATVKPIVEATYTIRALKDSVPEEVPGVAFASGGQSDEDYTANLSEMNKQEGNPWSLTFSAGRALQRSPLAIYSRGGQENHEAAQDALLERARDLSMATLGKY
tara:strand:+ start:158 stop:1147 length:990 start_codon:yes stop_codon:yes gene_type:complete